MTDQSAIAATQSVLDKLVAGVSDRKAAKGARLTPTVSEAKLAPALPTAAFPYDNPETMIRALETALVEIDHVRAGIVTLIDGFGGAVAVPESAADTKKDAEKAADEAHFARQFAAQQAEAQTAAFGGKASIMRGLDINDQRLADAKAARIAALRAQLEELG